MGELSLTDVWLRVQPFYEDRASHRAKAVSLVIKGSFGHPWTSVDGTLERVRGIEPLYEAWEAAVLPLNYTRSPLRL